MKLEIDNVHKFLDLKHISFEDQSKIIQYESNCVGTERTENTWVQDQ